MKHQCSARNGLMQRGRRCNCLARFARQLQRHINGEEPLNGFSEVEQLRAMLNAKDGVPGA